MDLLIQNLLGVTPLNIAAYMDYKEMAKVLLNKPPEMNLCPNSYSIPLIAAIQSGHINIVSLLLQGSRISLNATDRLPCTIIQHIKGMYWKVRMHPSGESALTQVLSYTVG